ncbi:hypothetical protein BKA67DRAFT_654840 [Truncatella angustata]|uniref:HSF-type DNA-binding domain-containing protein n=1 Tax=Truncatella angustata TaxID=152316 RepID=A0A9P8UR44_9PEZI|nr:uncharacterized protein BKA67DRAFT_654840 [Truncatella angustata]KAH6656505.1 hypothetical protein BKA67DRAFT_654840 [Truncatella angustata]KAH8199991.1 hypothetical protein TruAng_005818 [Truncatella angustata]
MSSPTNSSRKRRAPGTVPTSMQTPYFPPTTSLDQSNSWNVNNLNYMENSANANPYGVMSSPRQAQFTQQGIPIATPSTALARRGVNNQLVATNRAYSPQENEVWSNFGDGSLVPQQNGGHTVDEHDNVELLEEKAQKAKRDAQAKRKQIPPFVQKLNSFLESSKNTELIRWSDKGDSFVVLDEDEFAKTLIPELFKHNNYASFVRQLNMYGFHKKVGLSDNSMKASERKNKSPSEYYNPYFRRGHPNLLWLINKPKSGTSKKKGKRSEEPDGDSDDDMIEDAMLGTNFNQPAVTANRALPAPESGALSRKDLTVVRDQMTVLQDSQRAISDAITRLRREHVQLVTQARQFQDQHNRHEQSINAILSFLANVFKGKIDPNGEAFNINDLFSGMMSSGQIPQSQQSGTVVDLGDWDQQQPSMQQNFSSPPKRQQRLLPPIPQDPAIKRSASASTTPSLFDHSQHQIGTVTELFDSPSDSAPTPSNIIEDLNTNPQEGMMRLMNDVNSNASNGKNPVSVPDVSNAPAMTNAQRTRMLDLMSAHNKNATATPVTSGFSAPPLEPSLIAPAQADQPSLLPIIGPAAPPPSMARIHQNQDEIEQLQRLQEQQSNKLDELSSLLGPYSPSGRIPGLEENGQYFDDHIDFGQYLDSNAYNADALPNEFDFGTTHFDNTNLDNINTDNLFADTSNGAGRIMETNTPNHRSPSTTGTEEISRDEFENSPGRAVKRQRKD